MKRIIVGTIVGVALALIVDIVVNTQLYNLSFDSTESNFWLYLADHRLLVYFGFAIIGALVGFALKKKSLNG